MGNNNQKPHIEAIDYNQIKTQLTDLDLIVFANNDIVSRGIRFFESITNKNGSWSHVGIVVSTNSIPNIQNAKDNEWYILESTLSTSVVDHQDFKVRDVESGKYVFGVQIRPLEDVLSNYTRAGRVAWAKLNGNPFTRRGEDDDTYNKRIKKIQKKLSKVHDKYYHRTYEINPFDCIGAFQFCGGSCGNCICCDNICSSGNKFVFCSQIVAIIYQAIGIISKKVIPNKILPVDLYQSDSSVEYKEGIFPKELVQKPIEICFVKN